MFDQMQLRSIQMEKHKKRLIKNRFKLKTECRRKEIRVKVKICIRNVKTSKQELNNFQTKGGSFSLPPIFMHNVEINKFFR